MSDAGASSQPLANDAARLLEQVYGELRQLAAARLAREKPGQTIQATALVHEAYLRLLDVPGKGRSAPRWDSRGHFFAAAAEAMRRILVEQARRKKAIIHGGGRQRVDLHESAIVLADESVDILALSAALDRLAAEEPDKATLVKLRHFAGLTIEQAAEALGISHATAERWWTYARLRLFQWLQQEAEAGTPPAGPGA